MHAACAIPPCCSSAPQLAAAAACPTNLSAALDACLLSAGIATILASMPPADACQLVAARRFLAAFPLS